jgi:YD repeat-containing protein
MDVNTGGGATCNGSGDTRYYYHQSDINSVLGLTNAGGNRVEAYEYDPYGRHVVISDPGGGS